MARHPDVMQKISDLELAQTLANYPAHVREAIAKLALGSQKSVQEYPYHSVVRIGAARTGAGPFVYTVPQQTVKAFNYKVGDPLQSAGFPTAYGVATLAETNLVAGGSQTNRNSDVVIWGIAIELLPNSEIAIAEAVMRNTYLQLSLGGSITFDLGPISQFPCGGSLFGAKTSKLVQGPVNTSQGDVLAQASNGYPTNANYYELPDPVIWEANRTGSDSSLTLSFTTARSFALTAADRVAAAGVEPFTAPADGAEGTFADFRVVLRCVETAPRSKNQ
jgi:hypothetical protein